MSSRFHSSLTVAISALWLTASVPAQDYPPAPPVPLRIVTEQAPVPEPTPVEPFLPGSPLAQVAPLPDDFLAPDPNMAVPEADVEAFARGQVHEAFADVYELDPAPNVIVTVAPPAPVDELPPEEAPTGDDVQWISGYWGWDAESTDYIWVSGVWRDVPPGRRWVPGYWAEATGGFQWVSGFWTNAESQELAYLPQPPASLEVGPNVPPPSDDQVWVPGNWSYVSNDYRWSPGYYTPCQTDYMWIPNQYNWTPRGCVFVAGYWDYRFARRGTLFSPVRFRRPLVSYGFGRPAYYRPRYSVNMSSFLIHLFVRPLNRNFFYGDYYGSRYAGLGFTPWYQRTVSNRRLYDPAYNFYRMDSRRQGLDFHRTVNTWHQRYESNRDIRPPRLIQDQTQFLARHPGDRTAQLAVMTNRFADVVRNPQSGQAFHKMERRDIDLLRENSQVTRHLQTARRQLERDSLATRTDGQKPGTILDLRNTDPRDRTGRDGQRGDATPGTNGRNEQPQKLVLTDLPERLKAKSRESAATVERMSNSAGRRDEGRPQVGNRPTFENGSKPVVNDRTSGRPDRSETRGATDGLNGRDARLEELRQKGEERRMTRDAGQPAAGARPAQVLKPDAAAGRAPRIIEGGPLRNPLGDSPVRGQRDRVIDDAAAKPRGEERRQGVQEQPVRERPITNRQDNPAPVAKPQPVERPTRTERAPVEQAPRRIERQAPVQRTPPQQVERRAPVERAPAERAPRAPREAPGRRGKG